MYKVLTPKQESTNQVAVVKYTVDTWVYPQFGKLFVFNHLDNARRWVWGDLFIWECEVINPVRCMSPIAPIYAGHTTEDRIRAWWEFNYKRGGQSPPIGTFTADAVKITKKVL